MSSEDPFAGIEDLDISNDDDLQKIPPASASMLRRYSVDYDVEGEDVGPLTYCLKGFTYYENKLQELNNVRQEVTRQGSALNLLGNPNIVRAFSGGAQCQAKANNKILFAQRTLIIGL